MRNEEEAEEDRISDSRETTEGEKKVRHEERGKKGRNRRGGGRREET